MDFKDQFVGKKVSNFWPGCIQGKKSMKSSFWERRKPPLKLCWRCWPIYAYKQDCLDTSYIFVRRDNARKKCMFLRTCRSLMNVKFRRTEVSVFAGTKQRILGKCWANVERSVQTASTPFNIFETTCSKGLPKIRDPESRIRNEKKKNKKMKFVDMKISTNSKVKVTWETVLIALDKL